MPAGALRHTGVRGPAIGLRSACALALARWRAAPGVMCEVGGFGTERGDPLVPQQECHERLPPSPALRRPMAGLKNGLFLYGPAHRAQMLAETQGGRVLALGKVGAELDLGS